MFYFHVRKLTVAVTVKKPSNMLEIIRKCSNIIIFSKNADVSFFFFFFEILLLKVFLTGITTKFSSVVVVSHIWTDKPFNK